MRVYLYALFDKVSHVFNPPIQEVNDASAIRAFIQSVKDSPHKNDYELWKLGEFDNNDGQIYPGIKDSQTSPVKLYTGLDILDTEVTERKVQ